MKFSVLWFLGERIYTRYHNRIADQTSAVKPLRLLSSFAEKWKHWDHVIILMTVIFHILIDVTFNEDEIHRWKNLIAVGGIIFYMFLCFIVSGSLPVYLTKFSLYGIFFDIWLEFYPL